MSVNNKRRARKRKRREKCRRESYDRGLVRDRLVVMAARYEWAPVCDIASACGLTHRRTLKSLEWLVNQGVARWHVAQWLRADCGVIVYSLRRE